MTPGYNNTVVEIPPPPTVGIEYKSMSRPHSRSRRRAETTSSVRSSSRLRYAAVSDNNKSTESSVYQRRSSNALQSLNPYEPTHLMKIVKYGISQPRPEFVTCTTSEIDANSKKSAASQQHTCAAPPVIYAAPSYSEAVESIATVEKISTGFSRKKRSGKSSTGNHTSPIRSHSGSHRLGRSKSSTGSHTVPRSRSPCSDVSNGCSRGRARSPNRRSRTKSPSGAATPMCQSLTSGSSTPNNNNISRPKRGRSTSPKASNSRSITPPARWHGGIAWSNSHIKTTVAGELAEKWDPLPPRPSYKHRRPKRFLEKIADVSE